MNNSILLIGKPHSSKTVFLAQFYLRLQKNKSQLKLYKPVANLTPIAAALAALTDGKEPEPTHSEQRVPFVLPITNGLEEFDLLCPEYGGEQINNIIRTRELDKQWIEAIDESNNWLFFIRLNGVNKAQDIADITPNGAHVAADQNDRNNDYGISDQIAFIELLQILLFQKNNDYHFRNKKVKLSIALTCWDELIDPDNPAAQLKKELPLLYAFIDANWQENSWQVLGLSALEFSLKSPGNQEKYAVLGPESFGYLVLGNKEITKDITQLIGKAIQ